MVSEAQGNFAKQETNHAITSLLPHVTLLSKLAPETSSRRKSKRDNHNPNILASFHTGLSILENCRNGKNVYIYICIYYIWGRKKKKIYIYIYKVNWPYKDKNHQRGMVSAKIAEKMQSFWSQIRWPKAIDPSFSTTSSTWKRDSSKIIVWLKKHSE